MNMHRRRKGPIGLVFVQSKRVWQEFIGQRMRISIAYRVILPRTNMVPLRLIILRPTDVDVCVYVMYMYNTSMILKSDHALFLCLT